MVAVQQLTVAKGRGVLRDGDDGVRTLDLSVTGRMPRIL